jgi:carbamoyl-phosphate synthase small subunit
MGDTAYLILENGKVFEGKSFGKRGDVTGEIVFTTGMTGYLETLTDQSYYGQIILQTFPLIGNYGVIPDDFEGGGIAAKGYIVKHPCHNPSNFRSQNNIDAFLKERGIPGLYGIDTRALTKIIRNSGVMNGKITSSPPADTDREEAKKYCVINAVASVSSGGIKQISKGKDSRRIALMDFGVKKGMEKALAARDCEVWRFPHDTPAQEILKIKPRGILLSNGPGDPAEKANEIIVDNIQKLFKSGVPIFGICLGHQLMA